MMSQAKLKFLICRTCVRDNPGEGVFSTIESLEKTYRQQLKSGLFSSVAEIELQNCFSECENFHCVQLTDAQGGVRLKKISTPQQLQQVVQWIKDCQKSGKVELPEGLQEHHLQTIRLDD